MSNVALKWNVIDSIIYKIESGLNKIATAAKETKDELPDPEEMITAATEQLQKENDALKQLQLPGKIIFAEGKYYCPHCKTELAKELIEEYQAKHCTECGKRIVLQKNLYATSHKELNTNLL